MPKAKKDYSKTIIYRIPVGNENYYGHTTQPLHKRKAEHKQDFKHYTDRKLYKAMRDVGLTENDIELIWVEDWSCDNVNQARARERYWVERDGTLNTNVPNRSVSEYRSEYMREYRLEKRVNDEEWIDRQKEQQRKQKRERYANDEEWRGKIKERNCETMRSKYANDDEWRNKLKEKQSQYGRERVICGVCGKNLSRSSLTYHIKNICKNAPI